MIARRCLATIVLLSILQARPAFARGRYTVSDESAAGPGTPGIVVLRDNVAGVEAAVTPSEGGELSSYRVKFNDQWIELLYRARDYSPGPGFKGKGPLLWPAPGGVYRLGTVPKKNCNEGEYQLRDKIFPMPCHGFARSLPWTEVRRSASKSGAQVTLELRDSERTRAMYPFAFQLDVTYKLARGHFTIDYTVTSGRSNAEPMIFSIGNHITFNVPFLKGSDPAAMTFETPSTVQLLRNAQGELNGESKQLSFDTPTRLDKFDAQVSIQLAGYRGQPYVRMVDPQGLSLCILQQASSTLAEPLVRFTIYGGPKAGYLSPEPWLGLQNSLNSGQGLIHLDAGKTWKWRIELQAADRRGCRTNATRDVACGSGCADRQTD